jgi:hypothetical protein
MLPVGVFAGAFVASYFLSDTVKKPIDQTIATLSTAMIKKFLHMGYQILPKELVEKRNQALVDNYGAETITCSNDSGAEVKFQYIPSSSLDSTGNVLIICLNKMHEEVNPRSWEIFLKNGADIVLWNPTDTFPKQYQKDLEAIIKKLREKSPEQVIALKTHCASTDPSIAAAAATSGSDAPIHIICDRGQGDTNSLARSFTFLANTQTAQEILKNHFICDSINKIKKVTGRILFFIPQKGRDQVMQWGARNLTKELADQAESRSAQVEYVPGDHWSSWGPTAYSAALKFLADVEIVSGNPKLYEANWFSDPKDPGFLKGTCVSFLTKAWC